MRGFINGIVFTLALLIAAAIVAVMTGALYAGADRKPSSLEAFAAKKSLNASIARAIVGVTSPIEPTDANLLAGVHLYANNCAICHGAADAKVSTLAQGFYIEAPQLAKHGVEDDPPSETFWKVKHGIRFSAMPAFDSTLSDTQLWQIALFVSKMDALSPSVADAWKQVPSAAASPEPLRPYSSDFTAPASSPSGESSPPQSPGP